MAIVTREIGIFAGGLVIAQVDFNDANGNMTKARIINNSASPAEFTAILDPPVNGFSSVGMTGLANATTVNNLPNNTIKLTQVTEDGETDWSLIGVSLFCRWPAV